MSTATASNAFPLIDARTQNCITDAQAQFFLDNGLLVIRNLLAGDELKALQDETAALVASANAMVGQADKAADYAFKKHEISGKEVPFRVEYVIDKTRAGKVLAGHPFILRSVEKLQGRNFIPTWDAMVFKNAGGGAAIPWHRDAGTGNGAELAPIFNVDFYLDEADTSNCLWGILGSHKWSDPDAVAKIRKLTNAPGDFSTDPDCVPILMKPGDVIIHNILALHGSPAASSHLRRVIYYEYRPIETELEHGPHTPAYVPVKQKLLQAVLRDRASSPHAKLETPFAYTPDARHAPPEFHPEERLPTYRYPHDKYWR